MLLILIVKHFFFFFFETDKGIQSFAAVLSNYPIGIVKLNLGHCGLTGKGIAQFCQAIIKNQKTCTVLSSLSIAGNKLEKEGKLFVK
jgi:hypothetical protein